jgi:hypothetical protein
MRKVVVGAGNYAPVCYRGMACGSEEQREGGDEGEKSQSP